MWTDLSRFKVIHGDKVLNAVALVEIRMPEGISWEDAVALVEIRMPEGISWEDAVALVEIRMPEGISWEDRETIVKPRKIDVLAINEDGNLVSIMDEAWMFQFLPIVSN